MVRVRTERSIGTAAMYLIVIISGVLAGNVAAGPAVLADHECGVFTMDIYLSSGSDNYVGSDHREDKVHGMGASDKIVGNACADVLRGNDGIDQVRGNRGADTILGNHGQDDAYMWNNSTTWTGGLYGGDGNDTLYGGPDQDTLWDDDIGNDQDNLYGEDGAGDYLRNDDGDGRDYASCGDGGSDLLWSDSTDTGGYGCETIEKK